MPKHKSCLKPGYEPIVVARKPAKRATPFPGLEDCSIAGGRWPSNIVLDQNAAAELDRQSGQSRSRIQPKTERKGGRATNFAMSTSGRSYDDAGGASRYFPVFGYYPRAKASERPVVDGVSHPTCKPLALMRWLTRLVTPDGGYVLDPFAGSGTTIEAAELEGFSCLAIEREPKYVRLALRRMSKYEKEETAA